MPGVSKIQIERAREIDVLDYILTHERDNLRRVGGEYRLRDHDSLAVDSGKWYWHSQKTGGATALDFLIKVRGYSLPDAVCLLLNEVPAGRSDKASQAKPPSRPIQPQPRPPPKRKVLVLPPRNRDNRRAIAYLQSRGISKSVIDGCIKRGSLYESALYHNCVFVGRDEKGKARFAAMRSTVGSFRRDADGSDKRFGFLIPPKDTNSREIAVFEAPIDCLSHQTLCEQGRLPQFSGWRLALGGTSLLALNHFLGTHNGVTRCIVCTDNDEAGNEAAAKIAELPDISVVRSAPPRGKDWNETLQFKGNEVKNLEDKRKDIRFITSDYKTLFTVKDGDSIKFTSGYDGEVKTLKCRFIDEAHLMLIGNNRNYYHICELAEIFERNGSRCEEIPNQKPMLNILAAKYGEPLQDVEIPMTDAAIKEYVGGEYEVAHLKFENGDIAATLISGYDGCAICGINGDAITSLHPYTALKYKREFNPLSHNQVEKKPSLLGKLDGAKEWAAAQVTATHGDNPQKHNALELR